MTAADAEWICRLLDMIEAEGARVTIRGAAVKLTGSRGFSPTSVAAGYAVELESGYDLGDIQQVLKDRKAYRGTTE